MATTALEKLFDDVGSLLSPKEIQDVVQTTKNYLQSPLYSKIENNDFGSFSKLLQKHGRLRANNLGILENYVAPKASRREEIEKAISQFKTIAPEEYISEVFVGRESEMEKINERLQNPRVKALSLFGPPGVGKTTLAFEAAKSFYTSGEGKAFDFVSVDLKGSKRGTQSLNFHVLQAFGVQTIAYELEVIRKHVNTLETRTLVLPDTSGEGKAFDFVGVDLKGSKRGTKNLNFRVLQAFGVQTIAYELEVIQEHVNTLKTRTLVLLDNVEQFLIRTEGEKHDENFIKLLEIMMQSDNIKMILTSRAKIDEPSLRKFGLSEFEVNPLSNNLAKDMMTRSLGTVVERVSADTVSKIVEISRNKPLLLKGILPIVRAEIRSLEEVVNNIEENLRKNESDTGDEMKDDSCFREMFEALTSEQQKETIKLSHFRVAFSVSDAEKLLGKPSKECTNLTLEFLNQAKIVSIHDSSDKSVEKSYEIHPRLLEFLGSLKKSSAYAKEFAEAEELFYKIFVEKICKLSELLETDVITAYNEMAKHRPNFELTLEIATNTPFLLHLDDYHKDALIFILFEAMLNVGQRRNFYSKWSSIAKEEGKWLVAGQLKCWEAEQVISLEGPNKALGVLEEARAYLDKAKPLVSKESFEVEQSLYLYVRGEILEDLGKVEDALEDLEQSLKIRRSVFGKHSLTTRTMNAIGNCLQCLERYDEAQEYYYKTKEMREELTGSPKHFDMLVYYNQLATIHEVKGCKLKYSSKTKSKKTLEQANKEFQTCISWYQKALKLEADLGIQGYGNTARYYRNMANTFMHLEKYDEALECALKALEIRKEIFNEHPDTVKSLYQVGIALEWKAHASNKDSKLLEEALTYYEEAKKMLQNLPEHNRGPQELQQQIEDRCKVLPVTLQEYEEKKKMSKKEDEPMKAESANVDVSATLSTLTVSEGEGLPSEDEGLPSEGEGSPSVTQEEETDAPVDGRKVIHNASVSTEACEWNIGHAGVYLNFPEGSVESATQFNLFQWSHDKRAPPLHESEAHVSSVVQLAPIEVASSFSFKEPVELVFSHGAPDCNGYEVVIKQLEEGSGNWVDLDTRDFQTSDEILKDEYESPEKVPDYVFPIAIAEIKECSTFAVVYRLRTYPATVTTRGRKLSYRLRTYPATFTTRGGKLSQDDITVVFPKNATKSTFHFGLKIQHVPHSLLAELEQSPYTTPILHFSCPNDVKLDNPVTVRVPLIIEGEDTSPPDFSVEDLRIFYRKSFTESDEKPSWEDHTGSLVSPPKLEKRVVELQLKKFSSIWAWVTRCAALTSAALTSVANVYRAVTQIELQAAFALYQDQDYPEILKFVCLPPDQYGYVILQNTQDGPNWKQVGYASSYHTMKEEEIALVKMNGEKIMKKGKELTLKFSGRCPFIQQRNVTVNKEKNSFCFLPFKTRIGVEEYCSIDASLDAGKPSKKEYSEEDAILEESQSKVVLLGDEWGSLKGDLSTFNRQLAVHLAKRSDLKVSCFFPEVSDSDKNAASKEKVTLIEADPIPGNRDPLVKLQHWPTKQPFPDVIISHDHKFGRPAYCIKKKTEYRHCKWVHFVHVNYEEMGKYYKGGSNKIRENNLKDDEELRLCKNADVVVAVGPQLLDKYSKSLSIEQEVQVIYPGLSKELENLPQNCDSREFHVYIYGCCSLEDFELKGVDIAANAVGKLGKNYKLHVVGVQENEEENTLEHILKTTAAKKNQLLLREYCKDQEQRRRMICEADLVVMPSRAEAFGWIGLEALSACIPLLVSAASGLGVTLRELTFGDICVVESDESQEWAEKIKLLKEKERSQRIEQMKQLRNQYDEKYKWEEQCSVLAKLFRDDCNDGQGKDPTN